MSHFICFNIVQLLSAAHKNVEGKESQRINLILNKRQFLAQAVFKVLLCKLIPYDIFKKEDECDGLRRGEFLDCPYSDDIIQKNRNPVMVDSLKKVFKNTLYTFCYAVPHRVGKSAIFFTQEIGGFCRV